MGASGMGGQWYGGPLLWVALWPLKDPMLRRESGCAAVTPGVALASWLLAAEGQPPNLALGFGSCAASYSVCSHRSWVVGGSGRCREVTCLTGPGTVATWSCGLGGVGWRRDTLVAWVWGVGVTSWKPLLLLATLLRAQVLLRAPTLVTVRGALIVAPVIV